MTRVERVHGMQVVPTHVHSAVSGGEGMYNAGVESLPEGRAYRVVRVLGTVIAACLVSLSVLYAALLFTYYLSSDNSRVGSPVSPNSEPTEPRA